MATVVFYISGHGFGHASRQIEVINALLRVRPDVLVHVRTRAARWLFDLTVEGPFTYTEVDTDVGVVQVDALTPDLPATLDRAQHFYATADDRAAREAGALATRRGVCRRRRCASDRICRRGAGRRAGRRADELHLGLDLRGLRAGTRGDDGRCHRRFDDCRPRRRKAGACRCTAGSRDSATCATSRWSRASRGGAARRHDSIWAGPTHARSCSSRSVASVSRACRWTVWPPGKTCWWSRPTSLRRRPSGDGALATTRADGVVVIDERRLYQEGLRYEDVVAAADVVVTKPGYGIIAECIANGTAMLFTARGRFAEYDALVREMPRWVRSRFIPRADLLDGRWHAGDRRPARSARPARARRCARRPGGRPLARRSAHCFTQVTSDQIRGNVDLLDRDGPEPGLARGSP